MKNTIIISVLTICMCLAVAAGPALAADKGVKPNTLICAISNYYECTFEKGCQETSAEEINAPRFFKIMLDKKSVSPLGQSPLNQSESKIGSMIKVEDMIILQGVEAGDSKRPDGVGWTASISIETGKIVLTASGMETGFVGTGACAAY
jgi:hypothetical protein